MKLALFCSTVLLTLDLAIPFTRAAAPVKLWEGEAETVVPASGLLAGAAVADDPKASGGKAIRLAWQKDKHGAVLQFTSPALTLAGNNEVTFLLRGQGLLPLSNGLKIYLIAHDKATGSWAYSNAWMVYGINLKTDDYTPVTLTLTTGAQPETFRGCEILFEWEPQPAETAPVLFFDRVTLAGPAVETPRIMRVQPGKIRYQPGDKASATVTLANPSAREASLVLKGEDRSSLAAARSAFTEKLTLKPGETKDIECRWKLDDDEFGHELSVSLLEGERELDRTTELFSVCRTPLWLSVGNGYDRGTEVRDRHTIFYIQPATRQESWKSIDFFRRQSPGGEGGEFFSWSPGDISDLAPTEEPFPGGEGRMVFRSRETVRMQTGLMRSVGQWPISYVNGTCWAESGYKLFSRHPEWFLFDANGEVAHYEMDHREIYQRKNEIAFDPATYPVIFFQATLNHSLPEVQEFIAREYVRCGREMGFKGVRMDVRYLEVHPGEYNFTGKEVAPTAAEADRISAAAIKRVKELVHKELPDFTFGYNYASPDETADMPLTFAERCAGGGWMLDEVPCGYQEKTSPYHLWEPYARRMISWGDHTNRLGGIYNPFDFRRGGGKYVVDNIYSTIFRLIAGGRFGCYNNSRQPFGDLGRFACRYSEFFYSPQRQWLAEVKDEVTVKAPAPLWWKDMVFRFDGPGPRRLLVNLVNPPTAAEVEENPLSEIRPPVRNIVVSVAAGSVPAPRRAWLLAAEPDEPQGTNAIRQVELPLTKAVGRMTVTVPAILFWKMVVFEY